MTTDTNIGRLLEGKYEIVRVLGQGGMGVVYEARHRLINRRLAVKLLHAEYAQESDVAERFRREAQAASAIGHEHIVDVTDMGFTDKDELFIAMEYLEGVDLSSCLQNAEVFSPERACHIMIQVLSALEAAHAKGIVHRDLKPANIFIIQNREGYDYVKLVDFGISKIQQDDEDMRRALTRTGEILGTPSFMSPEQARGETDIGPASDIFSCGLILYRLLTGQTAFDDKVLTMLLLKIIDQTPPKPIEVVPNVPLALSNAVMRAIEKNPANRFPDAASFRRVLTPFSPETAVQTGLSVTRFTDTSPRLTRDSLPRLSTGETPLHLSDTHAPIKSTKKTWLFAVLTAALIFGAAGLFFFKFNNAAAPSVRAISAQTQPQPQPQPKPMPPPVPVSSTSTNIADTSSTSAPSNTPPVQIISLKIDATPATAAVWVDGEQKGTGSISLTPQKDNKGHVILVSLAGYTDFQQEILFDRDVRLAVQLSQSAKTKPPKSVSGKTTPSKPPKSPNLKGEPAKAPEPVGTPLPIPSEMDDSAAKQPKSHPVRTIDEVNPW